jgi:hypothetical protein
MAKNQAAIIAIARTLRDVTGNLPILPAFPPSTWARGAQRAGRAKHAGGPDPRELHKTRVILSVRTPTLIYRIKGA